MALINEATDELERTLHEEERWNDEDWGVTDVLGIRLDVKKIWRVYQSYGGREALMVAAHPWEVMSVMLKNQINEKELDKRISKLKPGKTTTMKMGMGFHFDDVSRLAKNSMTFVESLYNLFLYFSSPTNSPVFLH